MPSAGIQLYAFAPQPLTPAGGADVSCPAGSTTVAVSIGGANQTVTPAYSGNLFGCWSGVLYISLGATPPTALAISAAYNVLGGVQGFNVPVSFLTASANLAIPIGVYDTSQARFIGGAALAPQITVNPTGQLVNVRGASLVTFTAVAGQ